MKLTGATILASRGMKFLQAAPAAYLYRSASKHMGVATRVLGYIEEAWPGVAGGGDPVRIDALLEADRLIGLHNESVLEALGAEDSWPPLCRPPMITYKNRLILVGASLKNLEGATRNWLDKFESLLRQLYWESAYIRCEFGLYGPHEFRWRPPESWIKELCQARLSPIREWSFESTLQELEKEKLQE